MVGIGLGALALTACASDDDSSADSSATDEADDSGAIAGGEDAPAETADAAVPETGGAASAGLPIDDLGREIITSVELTMSTSNVRKTTDDIRRLAQASGGAVYRSDVSVEDELVDGTVPGGGQIVIRIPPQDLDGLIEDLDGAGLVTRVSQDSEDVTEQLVDLDIRIRQAETGIERIEELLTQATALENVFAIETELSTRQVELERLRAAERSTEDLVALATVTVQVDYRTPAEIESDPSDDGIVDAFASGWDAFVGVIFAFGFVLAVSAPFLLTATAVAALAWLLSRRWTRRRSTASERARIDADRAGTSAGPSPRSTPPPPPVDAHGRPDPSTAERVTADSVSDESTIPTE